MEKKRSKKVVLSRETLRRLGAEEARRAIGGDMESAPTESCVVDCGRLRVPVG